MCRLAATKLAYDHVKGLLDQEILKKKYSAQQVKDWQKSVDLAFYVLGWAQFEHLSRKEAEQRIDVEERAKTVHGAAWRFVSKNIKNFSLRSMLDVIFHAKPKILSKLHRNYDIRNEVVHENGTLPADAQDVSAWLAHLEELVKDF